VRSRVAAGTGYGSQHMGDACGLFALYPGWRILAPATPFDYIGLMNAAIRCDDPVMVMEHVDLFPTTGPIPKHDLDYIVPIGKAKIVRAGGACTVVAYSKMVGLAVDAAVETGIDAEVIDLRTVDPWGMDWATVEARDPGALLRLARPRDPAGHRRRRGPGGLQGPGASRPSRPTPSRRRPPRRGGRHPLGADQKRSKKGTFIFKTK
jgi:hypothetical protein